MSPRSISTGNSVLSWSIRESRVIVIIVLTLCVHGQLICGLINQPKCGQRHVSSTFLISHGSTASQGEMPWHAAIHGPVQHNISYACGGSIIGSDTILTAAHCFFPGGHQLKEDQILVYVGEVDLNNMKVQNALKVAQLTIHPNYTGKEHDIAILKLASEIAMTPFVQPVCLGDVDEHLGTLVGKSGVVVGFGATEHTKVSRFLQAATITVVAYIDCLLNDRQTYGSILTRNMYCAGGNQDASPCTGDSGGGMFFEKDNIWYVKGTVSFKAPGPDGYCDPSKYTVFTYINKYREWILSITNVPGPEKKKEKVHDGFRRMTDLQPCVDGTVNYGTTCNMAFRFDHGFLLYNQGGETQTSGTIRVPLNGRESYNIVKSSRKSWVNGLDRDCAGGRFYWSNWNQGSDFDTSSIMSAKYNGGDEEIFIKFSDSNRHPGDVAVDWISRRIYWTEREQNTINVASLENPNIRTVLISGNLFYPSGIAVDPVKSKLYWSDTKSQKIEWSNLDGTERELLVGAPQVLLPYDIQVLTATGELCYTDHGMNKIGCIDPSSKKIRTITSYLTAPQGLTITDELFYWGNRETATIESVNRDGVRQKSIDSPLFTKHIRAILAVTDKCPVFYSPCSIDNGDCPSDTICLVNPRVRSGKSCLSNKKCKFSYTYNCTDLALLNEPLEEEKNSKETTKLNKAQEVSSSWVTEKTVVREKKPVVREEQSGGSSNGGAYLRDFSIGGAYSQPSSSGGAYSQPSSSGGAYSQPSNRGGAYSLLPSNGGAYVRGYF